MTPKSYNTLGWVLYIFILVAFSVIVFIKNKEDRQMVMWSIGGATLLCIITGITLYSPNTIKIPDITSIHI